MVKEAYLNSKNLAEATRVLVNKIFKEFGLIIIDANNSKLKGLFKQSIINELTEGLVKNCSEKSIKKLKTLNYKIQAPPRDINLFYVQKNKRERLIKTGDSYTTENRLKSWTSEQIIKEINENPENFSPNVLMRPLYQEFVLPNLCYIGGPAEIAYWLEIKSVFDNEKITFPLLLSRCSALIISKKTIKKFKKYDLGIEEIFLSEHLLKNKLITKFSKHKLDFSDLKNLLKIQFSKLKDISKNTDKSFIGALSAQEKKQINGLTKLEKRLINSEKRIYSEKISKVMNLLSEVFPDGKFQERHLNFSDFYKDLGQDFIINIKDNLDPLNQKFTIIEI
jgi:bacillithiol biosynthesis cysteine-adding enzyme BshC